MAIATNMHQAIQSTRRLTDFRDQHASDTIVVCGCGVSVADMVDPQRFITIGVNDIGRRFEPDYLVVLNRRSQFKKDRFAYVETSRARALFTQLDLGIAHPNIVRIKLGERGGTDLSRLDRLPYTQNSPYVALCLAMYMGAKRIGLIGVDFTDHHFFGKTGRHPLDRHFKRIDKEYLRLAGKAREMSVEIVNLSETSRLSAFPKCTVAEFDGTDTRPDVKQSNVVSYATTPVAGVPAILARCIDHATPYNGTCVWATNSYGNGVRFDGDAGWRSQPNQALARLEAADLIIVHNGKVHPAHQKIIAHKPSIVVAHNYAWNVDQQLLKGGAAAAVVGQYQATLPEFRDWHVVPNPMPLWEEGYQPATKPPVITICYTPSGKHERFAKTHRLYWHSKGYTSTMKVLHTLQKKYGIRLEVIGKHQITHAESLAMKCRSHIVIDECVTGSYHRNSLEGLAAGCVVVNAVGSLPGVTTALEKCVGTAEPAPFVTTSLVDLESTLTNLIKRGGSYLEEVGRRNHKWLLTYWGFGRQWQHCWAPVADQAGSRLNPLISKQDSSDSRDESRTTLHSALPNGSHRPALSTETEPLPREAQGDSGTNSLGERGIMIQTSSNRARSLSDEYAQSANTGVSVVLPHGGEERLPQLRMTLSALAAQAMLVELIVVDMGPTEGAEALVKEFAGFYVAVQADGPFERARAINIGSALARHDYIFWQDNDLVVGDDFLANAVTELTQRKLDFLIPYTQIHYLAENITARILRGQVKADACRGFKKLRSGRDVSGGIGLVREDFLGRFGGMIEEFIGWGGEDNAWWKKATLLGHAAVTRRKDQDVWHLYHSDSGANRGSASSKHPHYRKNVNLLTEIRKLNSSQKLLRRYPPPVFATPPWSRDNDIVFVTEESWRSQALEINAFITEKYGLYIPVVDAINQLPARVDLCVVFGKNLLDAPICATSGIVLVAGSITDSPLPDCVADVISNGQLPTNAQAHVWRWAEDSVDALARATVLAIASAIARDVTAPEAGSHGIDTVRNATQSSIDSLPVWSYWEGPKPDWIEACHRTLRHYEPGAVILDWQAFDQLWDRDRDIDLQRLQPAHRADYIRAFLLHRYGGIWLDADCVVMKPMRPVLDCLQTMDFAAHRDRQNYYPNGFIGATRGSVIAKLFYHRISATLRSGKPLGWIELGGQPLTEILKCATVDWCEIECEKIQPVCWSKPATFFNQANPATHAQQFDHSALCYMLSNNEIQKYQALHPQHSLTQRCTFFSYLIERALGDLDITAALPCEPSISRSVFEGYYRQALKRRDESLSGPGSSQEQTRVISEELPSLLREIGVDVLVDAGCGDFNWLKNVSLPVHRYIGVDVVEALITRNQRLFGSEKRQFHQLDLLREPLPACDLVLCRDNLVHYSFQDALDMLNVIKRSRARYLLTTTFPEHRVNYNIRTGDWRPLNLQRAPFHFTPPLQIICEGCTEMGGVYADKSLGLWRLEDINLP